jgi:hypothetical protein
LPEAKYQSNCCTSIMFSNSDQLLMYPVLIVGGQFPDWISNTGINVTCLISRNAITPEILILTRKEIKK